VEENATEEAQVIPNNIAEKFLDNWISILMSLPQSLVQFLGGKVRLYLYGLQLSCWWWVC